LILQLILNKYLSLDPDLEYLLQPLANKAIAIRCIDYPEWQLYCTFTNQNLLFTSSLPQHVDVKVYSTFSGFIKFAVSKDKTELMIEGNIHTAEEVLKFFSALNIDWEEELSKYSGDVIAHQAGTLIARFKQYTNDSRNSLEVMISEYLQEESGLLPTHFEVKEFIDAVDQLRLDIDRLNARITVYENN
jgi:ubiquinone biosynthesis protein UbiJ